MSTDLASEASAFNTAISDPVPEIHPISDCQVQLLRGLPDPVTGEWQTLATVRELNGEDEERIAALVVKENENAYSVYMDSIIRNAVLNIGSIDVTADKRSLDNLMIGDRDLLFLGAIRATYGQSRTLMAECGHCQGSNDITIDLIEDFPINKTTHDPHKPIEVTTRKKQVLKFRLPTAADSKYVQEHGTTTAEQNTHMLARCVLDLATNDPLAWAKSLNLGDRNKAIKAIADAQVGPKLGEVKAQCAHCDEELVLLIDWVGLLFG